MEKLGGRLIYIRESLLDISQDEFAALIGVSQMSLSHWESNSRNPKGQYIDSIVSICRAKGFDISKSWIETGKEPMLNASPTEATSETDLAAKWKQSSLFYKKRADRYEEILLALGIDIDNIDKQVKKD